MKLIIEKLGDVTSDRLKWTVLGTILGNLCGFWAGAVAVCMMVSFVKWEQRIGTIWCALTLWLFAVSVWFFYCNRFSHEEKTPWLSALLAALVSLFFGCLITTIGFAIAIHIARFLLS